MKPAKPKQKLNAPTAITENFPATCAVLRAKSLRKGSYSHVGSNALVAEEQSESDVAFVKVRLWLPVLLAEVKEETPPVYAVALPKRLRAETVVVRANLKASGSSH